MGEERFDRRDQELLEGLADLATLLRAYGEAGWADQLDRDRRRIGRGDGYGLRHLLGVLGDKDALSGLLIHPANGHAVATERVAAVNDQLQALVGRCWRLADDLRRELDRPDP